MRTAYDDALDELSALDPAATRYASSGGNSALSELIPALLNQLIGITRAKRALALYTRSQIARARVLEGPAPRVCGARLYES